MSASNPQSPEPNPYSPPFSPAEPPIAWTSEPVIESLRQTRPWVMLLSIVGFIGAAIIFLAGLVQAAASLGEPTSSRMGATAGAGIFTALLALLYFVPSFYLWRFAGSIRALTVSRRLGDLEAALAAQKSFWRFCGIAAALLLVLYGIILAGALVVGFMATVRR